MTTTTLILSPTLSAADYQLALTNFIKSVEATRTKPYIDYSKNNPSVGNPTIGWGFTLNGHAPTPDFVVNILSSYFNFNPDNNQDKYYIAQIKATLNASWPGDPHPSDPASPTNALQATLNYILQTRANDPLYPAADRALFPTTFELSSDQVASVFNDIRGVYDGRLDATIQVAGGNVPLTTERIALFSMVFNGENVGAFWKRFTDALSMSNPSDARANAWYEIRYDITTSHPSRDITRAYKEAAMFGLYNDNSNVTVDDAKAIYRMFTLHRDEMLAYDKAHATELSNANVLTIQQALGSARTQILTDIAVSSNPDIVAAYQRWLSVDNNGTSFDSRNLYLDPGRADASQAIDPNNYMAVLYDNPSTNTVTGNAILIGESTAGRFGDYLIAGSGNDLLIGGKGNDVLVSGAGHDYMAGGEGDDTYIIKAGSHVTIEDKTGKNSLQIDGKSFSNFYSTDGGQNWLCDDPNVTAVKQGGDFIITDVSNSVGNITTVVTLNNDFQSGDFGIRLVSKAADTPVSPAPNNTTDRTITGDLQPVNYGTDANPVYHFDDLGNPITDGTPAPNRDDTLNGSSGNDLINAGGGDNTIYATQGGNDTIIAGDGYNRIFAGNGSNTITTGNGGAYIKGGSGNDRINAGNGFNVIDAQQGGNDTLIGGSGVDIISGSNGNDLITGGGEAAVVADSKYHDILNGGNGNNQIYANAQVDLATALANQKTPSTGSGQAATHQQGAFLTAADGDNTIVGGNGNDVVFVGTGANTIVMGAGNNLFAGGVEARSVVDWWGAAGNRLWGIDADSPGLASVPANYQGNAWNAATIADQWNGINNTITRGTASGTPFGTGNDTIFGGKGDSAYYLSNGDNWLDAGGGNDTIYAGIGHNTIFAGTGNDTIYGAGGSNYINLESGNDVMIAQGGNHTIIGGTGDDSITSGDNTADWATSEADSNNTIYGGSGQTIIYGSGGNDTLISGSQSGTGKSTVIHAGDGNAYIVGGDGSDTIYGGAGSDTIYAGDGNTTIVLSTDKKETSTVYGGNGADTIIGGAGNDVIYAGAGGSASKNTYVSGGDGNDMLVGGGGYSYLLGGSGSSNQRDAANAATYLNLFERKTA